MVRFQHWLLSLAIYLPFALAAGAVRAEPDGGVAGAPPTQPPSLDQRLQGRDQSSIRISRSNRTIRTFEVRREESTAVLYVQDRDRHWHRGAVACSGVGSPRFAVGLVPGPNETSLRRNSTVSLVQRGRSPALSCWLRGLVELTPEEALELGLVPSGARPQQG